MVEMALRPHGPYSLRMTCRRAYDATRSFRNRTLTAIVDVGGQPERVSASQRVDGTLALRAETEDGLDRLRFMLACDDDHTPFLSRFADDPLLAGPIRHLRGLRHLRTATVAQALLRAIAGQLIEAKRARRIEERLTRATTEAHGDLHAPPLAHHFGGFAPAELQRFGLSGRKATSLVRICRTVDLERLHEQPTATILTRLDRERGIGPWSVAIVCTEGLGRRELGLVGDLGLIKLCSAIQGRWVEADETAELLAPYGEWQAYACLYLMAGASRGLVPLAASRPEVRAARIRARYAA